MTTRRLDVQCELIYEITGSGNLLMQVKVLPCAGQVIVEEALSISAHATMATSWLC